ncbi:Pullulanase [Trichinella spiralis]|uniref:Pullulanase n=1 Tax=Trichinella spiralis TaxID=6334 RepID=A0ABR3KCN4_TRISP
MQCSAVPGSCCAEQIDDDDSEEHPVISIPQLDERQIELPQSREEKKTKSKSPSPRRLKLAYFNFVPGGELCPSGRSSFEKWNHVESEFKSGRRSAVVNVQERQLIQNGWDPRQRFQHKVRLCICKYSLLTKQQDKYVQFKQIACHLKCYTLMTHAFAAILYDFCSQAKAKAFHFTS